MMRNDRENGGAPAGDGGDQERPGGHPNGMPPGLAVVLCCRSADWTPVRGRRNREAAARRLPPLASGYRDPDAPWPSDAPDVGYGRRPAGPELQRPAGPDLWELAAQIAAGANR
jgi:hypothetical protein